MTRAGRHVLVLGPAVGPLDRLVAPLQGAGFAVHRLAPGPGVLELVQVTPFELLVVITPIPSVSLSELIAAVRDPGAPCRRAGLLVAATGDPAPAEALLGRGVNRVVRGAAPGRLLEAAADLLAVEPRVPVRAVVALEGRVDDAHLHTFGRTRDLSRSGMLLRGGDEFRIGARLDFELLLPGEREAVRGRVAVVRRADPERERVDGIGAAFERLDGDGGSRLLGFLDRLGA